MKAKFLVLHPSADIDKVVEKANLQGTKNGAFDAVLLLGDVVSTPNVDVDQSTYFTKGPSDSFKDKLSASFDVSLDIRPNLTLVQPPFSVLTLSSGVKIGFLCGPDFDTEKVNEKLDSITGPVDVLVSYKWPKAIAARQKLTLVADPHIDKVVSRLRPRYHFAIGSPTSKFFELAPFKWEDNTTTRFISLGQEGTGEKWFYAFGIDPQVPVAVPDSHLIANPFTTLPPPLHEERKRQLEITEEPSSKRTKAVGPESCFFCLSNPNVEKHMIVSIGKTAYLTTAKGPLPKPTKDMPFPCHAIIIPIDHVSTLRSPGDNVVENETYLEMDRFRQSVVAALAEKYPHYVLISFEINREDNVHLHVQLLPIHSSLLDTFERELETKTALNNEKFQRNQNLKFDKYTSDSDPQLLDTINNYDHIVFHVFSSPKTIYAARLTDPTKMVDLQFPRRVLAATLKCPKRARWDKCKQNKIQETADCGDYKSFFESHDFTKEG